MKTSIENASAPATGAHTPGPWRLRRFPYSGNHTTFVVDSTPDRGGYFVGQLIASGTTAPESEANLRLIAAAPELLAALRHFAICAEDANWSKAVAYLPELGAAMDSACAAIAKAEGRA